MKLHGVGQVLLVCKHEYYGVFEVWFFQEAVVFVGGLVYPRSIQEKVNNRKCMMISILKMKRTDG